MQSAVNMWYWTLQRKVTQILLNSRYIKYTSSFEAQLSLDKRHALANYKVTICGSSARIGITERYCWAKREEKSPVGDMQPVKPPSMKARYIFGIKPERVLKGRSQRSPTTGINASYWRSPTDGRKWCPPHLGELRIGEFGAGRWPPPARHPTGVGFNLTMAARWAGCAS